MKKEQESFYKKKDCCLQEQKKRKKKKKKRKRGFALIRRDREMEKGGKNQKAVVVLNQIFC